MNQYSDHQFLLRKRYKHYCRLYRQVSEHNDLIDEEVLRLNLLQESGVTVTIPRREYLDFPLMDVEFLDLTCGAKTRAGTPCKLKTLFDNGRCKFHGGLSTGAKTKAGKKRQREGQVRARRANPMEC